METAELVLAVAHLVVMCGLWVELGEMRKWHGKSVSKAETVMYRLGQIEQSLRRDF